MNIFVASWFFPPSTSSEGLVTYKLLRNSEHNYYVCSAISDNWSYKAATDLNSEPNINCFGIPVIVYMNDNRIILFLF